MKRHLLVILSLIAFNQLYSQQLYMEIGKTISSFDYKNSEGQSLDNLLSKPNTYIAMGYRSALIKEKLHLSVGGMYSGYGAIGSDQRLDNYFEWDVTYLGVEAGVDLTLFRLRDFTFYLKGSLSFEILLTGTQTINNQVFNLVGEDEFNNNIFFGRGSLGMQYPISNNTSIYANYKFGKTVLIGQGNASDKESLNLNAHQFGIGLIINLPNCNCPY